MTTKNLFFAVMLSIIITILFTLCALRGYVLICALLWITGGIVAFQLNIGTLFKKWDRHDVRALLVSSIIGLAMLYIVTIMYLIAYRQIQKNRKGRMSISYK